MLPSLADLDLERLSPVGRETLDTIAVPKADEDLTDEDVALRVGLTRRQVASRLSDLADELRAQKQGAVLPDLSQDDFDTLRESIRLHGQLEPVILAPDGTVIDGRNRLRACEELAVEPWCVKLAEDDVDVRTATLAANTVRRQLTVQQKERLVSAELVYDAERSDRLIASLVGVSHPFVGRVRRSLVRSGEVEQTTSRTDSLGRQKAVQTKLDEEGLPVGPAPEPSVRAASPHRLYVDETLFEALQEVETLARRYYDDHKGVYVDEELEEALAAVAELRDGARVV